MLTLPNSVNDEQRAALRESRPMIAQWLNNHPELEEYILACIYYQISYAYFLNSLSQFGIELPE